LEKTKKVLVCPLNWGLGHASRIIPIVHELIRLRYEVYIGAEGYVLQLLKQEFPEIRFILFPSYTVTYGKGKSVILPVILQIPKIILGIIKEHNVLKKLIATYSIDAVISDNRFGLWSKKAFTVYITHQINILLPGPFRFMEPFIYLINRLIILKYDRCWIPDFQTDKRNLTGALSHRYKLPGNAVFIGPLSRFSIYRENSGFTGEFNYDLFVILSGPEPQRTMLEDILTGEIKKSDFRAVIAQGRPGEKQTFKILENIIRVSHLSTYEFLKYICQSRYIICRSGFSTIMDLIYLKRTAMLIPTPGQTEQEYLARYLSQYFPSMEQDNISLDQIIKKLNEYEPESFNLSDSELKNYIQNLVFKKPDRKRQ
jgi:UDP:flavonoid glycosyltransferase YjiC (YdhE family)